MPRDFVPCVYTERELYDEILQTWHRRYEVTEVFQKSDRLTQEPLLSMSVDCHAYFVGTSESALQRLLWPTLQQRAAWQARQALECRTQLFDTFYAAMAALE